MEHLYWCRQECTGVGPRPYAEHHAADCYNLTAPHPPTPQELEDLFRAQEGPTS